MTAGAFSSRSQADNVRQKSILLIGTDRFCSPAEYPLPLWTENHFPFHAELQNFPCRGAAAVRECLTFIDFQTNIGMVSVKLKSITSIDISRVIKTFKRLWSSSVGHHNRVSLTRPAKSGSKLISPVKRSIVLIGIACLPYCGSLPSTIITT